ncbi:MAG: DUF6600 domain-containing protein [Verrucomicrobiota bacterium]
MNAPISRSSAALLAIGAVVILLLGAFSRDPFAALPALPTVGAADSAIEAAGGPELLAGLSPGLADLIRLAQAHVDENVILAFIQNSGRTYSPSADEILYLSDLGFSQTAIAALFKQKSASQPELAAAEGPTPAASARLTLPNTSLAALGANAVPFYEALAPYGAWSQIPDYGLCWQPTTEVLNPDWRPYVDQGRWLYNDSGWYWQSGYSWGGIAFHYGRWSKSSRFGWLWVPGNVWGPAWVSWRIAWSYTGWAPLPPGVGLAAAGLTFHDRRVAADFGFGLPAAWFTFVSEDNFLSRNLSAYAIPPGRAGEIYPGSVAVNNYSIVNNKVINLGPGRLLNAAVAEAGPAQPSIDRIPARKIELAGSPIAAGNDPQLPVAGASWEEAPSAPPRQSPGLDVPPLPSHPKARQRHWAWNYPAWSNRADAPGLEPLVNHEFFRHDQNAEAYARLPLPDPARWMATSVPSVSKSVK